MRHAFTSRLYSTTAIASAVFLALAPAAMAQTDESPAAESSDDTIVVTGSRIRRSVASTPNPVANIGEQEIVDRGYVSAADALNDIPSMDPQLNQADGSGASSGSGQQYPSLFGLGTGRTLKAAGELLPQIDAPDKKIVSLTGNFAPDGSAAFYSVIFTMADVVNARHYPLPLPVVAASPEERDLLHQQIMVHSTLDLAAEADVTFVGIGDLGAKAPLVEDGFITKDELAALKDAGAVMEIVGWAFDAEGRMIQGLTNARVASAPLPSPERSLVIAVAKGAAKLPGIRVAVARPLVNGLITDEWTAEHLLAEKPPAGG